LVVRDKKRKNGMMMATGGAWWQFHKPERFRRLRGQKIAALQNTRHYQERPFWFPSSISRHIWFR
jgi:hypothetical protein